MSLIIGALVGVILGQLMIKLENSDLARAVNARRRAHLARVAQRMNQRAHPGGGVFDSSSWTGRQEERR